MQEQEPLGDRKWVESYPLLKDLTSFEDSIGVNYQHIRLLARAFTDRSIGYTHLTMGSNQRLEFLGDTVLQLICSEYLYRHFPEHHEGHLSLLRSSLVNNRTQAVVCDDLGMTKYAIYANPKSDLKSKDRADLLEAFLGSLYVDRGLEFVEVFCQVCLFPRLQLFIMNQDWNDPKSKLQQCCLTRKSLLWIKYIIFFFQILRCNGFNGDNFLHQIQYGQWMVENRIFPYIRLSNALDQQTPESIKWLSIFVGNAWLAQRAILFNKVINHLNLFVIDAQELTVVRKLFTAEMEAAKRALENSAELFPQLDYQKRVMAHSMKRQRGNDNDDDGNSSHAQDQQTFTDRNNDDESNLPKQYRLRGDKSDSSESETSESETSDADDDEDGVGSGGGDDIDDAISSSASDDDTEMNCDRKSMCPKSKYPEQTELNQSTTATDIDISNDESIQGDGSSHIDISDQDDDNDNQQNVDSESSLESGEIS